MPGSPLARFDSVTIGSTGSARQEHGVENRQSSACLADIWNNGAVQLRGYP